MRLVSRYFIVRRTIASDFTITAIPFRSRPAGGELRRETL
jgi:hypothetical protein